MRSNTQNAAGQPAGAGKLRAVTSQQAVETLSIVSSFLQVRKIIRRHHAICAARRAELGLAKRTIGTLVRSPFNGRRIELLDEHISRLQKFIKTLHEAQQGLGRILIDMAPDIDAATSMEQRLELLNCNVADRQSIDKADIGMVELITVYCVEDSAVHRNDEFRDRPLHSAVHEEIIRVMFGTREGRAASEQVFDEAFNPGGLLHGVPTHYRQADGTMLRQAPALVLHGEAWSRVIERRHS